jgi:hypothetical protein
MSTRLPDQPAAMAGAAVHCAACTHLSWTVACVLMRFVMCQTKPSYV